MSGKVSGAVWDRELPANQRIVLLALADHADHDGTGVYPSVARIAWMTGFSTRQVQRLLRELEASGALVLVRESTHYQTREWEIHTEALHPKAPMPTRHDKMTPLAGRGDKQQQLGMTPEAERGDIQVSPEPSSKPSNKTREVWDHYVSVVAEAKGLKKKTMEDTHHRIIATALRVRSVDECKRAIDGLARSPHHNGENDRGKKYLDLRFALRGNGQRGESNAERIDHMSEIATSSDTARNAKGVSLKHTAPDPSVYDAGIEDA